MGPKLTDEKKQEMYEAWKGTNEYAAIEKYIEQRAKILEIERLELSVKDVSYDMQPFLDSMFQLVQDIKVPGKKAKGYEQQFVRTMIFDKIDAAAPSYTIDGIKYELTSVAANDTFKYKSNLVEIHDFVLQHPEADAEVATPF